VRLGMADRVLIDLGERHVLDGRIAGFAQRESIVGVRENPSADAHDHAG
jgi:hypothetical protein